MITFFVLFTEMMMTILKKNSKTISSVSIEKYDCDEYSHKNKSLHIISYSAALDLMSKSSIDIALKKIKKNSI